MASATVWLTSLLVVVGAALCSANSLAESRRGLFSFSLTPKTHLIITNGLEAGNKLTVRCLGLGGDDDEELVLDVGDRHEYTFNPRLFGWTVVTCKLSWGDNYSRFDAYRQERDRKRCGKVCQWIAAKGQVEGFASGGVGDIVYAWQHS